MGRGSTQVLIRKIFECLAKGPKTVTEIADETELDRTAISKYVKILIETKQITEETKGTSKVLTIASSHNLDTYFGLPLSEDIRKDFNTLYYLIKKNWYNTTNKRLTNTHAKKIAYKIIHTFPDELKHLPHGWYQYGGTDVFIFDNDTAYDYKGFSNRKIEAEIKKVTIEYSKINHAYEIKNKQYKEEPKELYETKEHILSILYSRDFDDHPKSSIAMIVKFLKKLFDVAPKDANKDYKEVMDAYYELMFDIHSKLDKDDIIAQKRNIIQLFEAMWKYIAMFNFKKDLLENKYYSLPTLDSHFYFDIVQQETEIVEAGIELQALIPEDEIRDPVKKKLHDALSQIKLLTPEESKAAKKKMDDYKAKNGLKALNDKLFKDVGL
jgi:hypothetical protein